MIKVDLIWLLTPALVSISCFRLRFMYFKKATRYDKIFSVDLTLFSKCQIDSDTLPQK